MGDDRHPLWLNPELIVRWCELADAAGDQGLRAAIEKIEPVPDTFALLRAMRSVECLAKTGDHHQRRISLLIMSEMDRCIGRI